jgi:hypothetical protein
MLRIFTKICDLTQFLLKFDRNNTLQENLKYVKFTISCWTLWGPKQEFKEKFVGKIRTQITIKVTVLLKSCCLREMLVARNYDTDR